MALAYPFITIEGNIGAGKTTLCHRLAARTGCSLILEEFADNPFLPSFYEQPERYAFPVELFFLTERHRQLLEHFSRPDPIGPCAIADYFLVKTLIFAKNNLQGDEFRLFQRLFTVLNGTFPKPDLLLYLHRPVPVLIEQIRRRGRDMEQQIAPGYLQQIQEAYLGYLKTETDTPVVVLDLGDLDFQQDDEAVAAILRLLENPFPKGMTVVNLI